MVLLRRLNYFSRPNSLIFFPCNTKPRIVHLTRLLDAFLRPFRFSEPASPRFRFRSTRPVSIVYALLGFFHFFEMCRRPPVLFVRFLSVPNQIIPGFFLNLEGIATWDVGPRFTDPVYFCPVCVCLEMILLALPSPR